jgi:MFS family permease
MAPEQPSRGAGASGRLKRALLPVWWDRNYGIVFAARVAMSVGRSLAGVAAPIYLALEGFSAFELSLFVLVVAGASTLMSTAIGLWSDRVGRRPFLVGVPLLAAGAAVGFAFTGSAPLLFVLGAFGSFGRGVGAGAGAIGPYQPAEAALVTEDLPAEHRNAGFGRLTFGSSAGATVGSLLALLVSSSHAHGAAATALFRPAFLAISVTSALAGVLALGLVEPGRKQAAQGGGGTDGPNAGVAEETRPPRRATGGAVGGGKNRLHLPTKSRWLLYRLWATNSLNGLAIGMFGPFVTYWLYRRFGASAAEVGALYAVINAATMASSLSAAGLARRWGLVRTVAVVRTAQALLIVPMVLAPSFASAGAVYFVRMIVQRIGLPLRQSYAIGLAHPDERASVAALSNVPSQLAMSASPLLTGYLFEAVSLSLPFELAAGLQFANAITFWGFFRHHPPEEETARELSAATAASELSAPAAELGLDRDDARASSG